MPPICGIFHFQRDVFSKEDIIRMMSSFPYHKDSETVIWHEELVSFGQRKSKKINLLNSDNQFSNVNDNIALVADARLDNSNELFEKLEIHDSKRKDYDETALIAASYQKWGEDCPKHLLGNFVFAVWDKSTKKLFLSHDHLGLKSLFYYFDSQKFVFATAPKAITEVHGVEKRFNRNKLIDLVVSQAKFLFSEETWFENIFALPAGMSLTVDKNGIRKRRFWEPQLGNKIPFKKDDEILEAFRDLMFKVVSDHIRSDSPVSALLSGGLDSSAIVSVATKILEKQNKQIHTLSAVLPEKHDPNLKDERYFIDQMRMFPNVSINYVTEPKRGPFDNLENLIDENNSPLISSRHYLYSAFVDKAKENSSKIILDGASGELSATFDGVGCYAEMFLRFKWFALWHELNQRKKLGGESIQYNLRANVISPLIPDFIYKLRHGNPPPLIKSKRTSQLLQKTLVEELLQQIQPRLAELDKHKLRISPFHRNNQFQLIKNVFNKTTFGGLAFTDLGEMEFRLPFRDKRLLEFCLAVPYNLKVRDGYQRYLVRVGLDKILPPKIQWRTTKQPFSPDYYERYNSQLPQILEFLSEIKPNDPVNRIVNIPGLLETAKSSAVDNNYQNSAGEIKNNDIPIGIYLIYFLRQFSEFKN